jgi:O-glycosyl hydrolase
MKSLLCCLLIGLYGAGIQNGIPDGGTPVIAADALLETPVGGLENTQATTDVIPVAGQPFQRALRVTIRKDSPETNATQLTAPISAPVEKGDTLLASFYLRGTAADGKRPAQAMLLFERRVSPWTKSISEGAVARTSPTLWRRVTAPFTAAETYRTGEAMVSLRFAFGPQTVEVGGLSVVDFGKRKTVSELARSLVESTPLTDARVTVNFKDTRQTMLGFGGDFCQPRYGATEPMDAVGSYCLENLHVAHARVGIPLNYWTPQKGVYRDDAQAHAAFLAMQELARRKIPIAASIWEGPIWLLGGKPEEMRRTLAPAKYADCIEAIARFLTTARDKYGVTADDISFNEADWGVNFHFTSAEIAAFIRQAGPRFRALGLPTKFLVGDTTGGMPLPDYARPLLEDATLQPYLGPLAFHCWDALGAPDWRYEQIAALGREFHKPVWCTEAGHDSALWQAPDPWRSWDNALRTALAYEKTLRLTDAALLDYWTYQDNYPIVDKQTLQPYPVFHVIRQMERALPAGAKIVSALSDHDELHALAAVGPGARDLSVLLINTVGAGRVTIGGLPPRTVLTVVRSDSSRQEVRQPVRLDADQSGQLSLTLTAQSVVTLSGHW